MSRRRRVIKMQENVPHSETLEELTLIQQKNTQDFATLYSIPKEANNSFIDFVSIPQSSPLSQEPQTPILNVGNPVETFRESYKPNFSEMDMISRQIAMMDHRIASVNSPGVFQPIPVISNPLLNPNELILVNPVKNLYYTREMIETEKINQIKSLERKAEILKARDQ